MPPNKNKQAKKAKARSQESESKTPTPNDPSPSERQEIDVELTGNEEYDKDIFIDMSTSTRNDIVVKEERQHENQILNQEQQVGSTQTSESQVHGQTIVNIDRQMSARPTSDSSSNAEINDASSIANVTKLNTPNGAEVYIVGTAHFSPQSVKDVRRVIKSVQPSSVLLELCRERAFMLGIDEESLLEQNKHLTFDKVRNAIAEKGLAQGLIYIMFIKMSAGLTEKLGMAPGAELRAGSAEAQRIQGCSVILADRSLKVTVARAVASVSFWQKIKLFYQVLANDTTITQEDVEKCKDKDMLEQLLEELGVEYPGFKRVILDERNIFLAHSIYRWAQNSETSLGPQKVVAIVGIGHVAGIVENWGKTTNEQIELLNEIPKTSITRRVITKTIKYCTVALIFYVGYRVITPSSIQSTVNERLFNRSPS